MDNLEINRAKATDYTLEVEGLGQLDFCHDGEIGEFAFIPKDDRLGVIVGADKNDSVAYKEAKRDTAVAKFKSIALDYGSRCLSGTVGDYSFLRFDLPENQLESFVARFNGQEVDPQVRYIESKKYQNALIDYIACDDPSGDPESYYVYRSEVIAQLIDENFEENFGGDGWFIVSDESLTFNQKMKIALEEAG
jgi:hypothetical protein